MSIDAQLMSTQLNSAALGALVRTYNVNLNSNFATMLESMPTLRGTLDFLCAAGGLAAAAWDGPNSI